MRLFSVTKVASKELESPATLRFQVEQTGRYVVSISASGIQTPLVSDETTVTGEEAAELPVENETSFQIEQRAEALVPGETATLTTKAPFPGIAWVSIETDKILDTLLVQIPGNAGRIEIPIKKEYAPNAFVSVYLTRPGGEKTVPLERFAYTEIAVQRPDWKLKIEPEVPAHTARPGEMIHGRFLTPILQSSWSTTLSCNLVVGNCLSSSLLSTTSGLSESKSMNR
jgi:uncharacterized protein YfaS (alpha-2-macroglobulin family)